MVDEKDDSQLHLLGDTTDEELSAYCPSPQRGTFDLHPLHPRRSPQLRNGTKSSQPLSSRTAYMFLLAASGLFLFMTGHVIRSVIRYRGNSVAAAHSIDSECAELDFSCKVRLSRLNFDALVQRQSTTPAQARAEYQRRYSRNPPPGFDHWLELAFQHNATLIDEYDRIEADLQPFRAAKIGHKRMQKRMQSAVAANKVVGVEDMFLGYVHTRNGRVDLEGFPWGPMGKDMLRSILEPIGGNLPNMTILKNYYTEPRVLLQKSDANVQETDLVNFEDYARQKTWDIVSEPCHEASSLSGITSFKKTSHATDICQYEDSTMRQQHGFFVAPLHFFPTSTLIPLLSNAKVSTMSDILVPNLCYASDEYRKFGNPDMVPFKDKKKSIYWRGKTTGMFHTMDNWRQGHRTRFVSAFQQLSRTIINIKKGNNDEARSYQRVDAAMEDDLTNLLAGLPDDAINVAFSETLGCDDETCKEMKKQLHFTGTENAASEFSHQLLGDVDGQGMSCRFYRQLSSNGLPIKHTIYQEWHDDRIVPWLHYVPLSLHMEEAPRLLAWLLNTQEGQAAAEEIAQAGRLWAERALRPIDVTLYYYRVLLEYAPIFNTGVVSRLPNS